MNDEIKLMLNIIKNVSEHKEGSRNGLMILSCKDYETLYDYITNLQQENEDNLKCIKSLKEQLESVINENQRLLKQWFEDNDKTVKLVSEKECYKQNYNDYKSRCEKAIDNLKRNYWIKEHEHNDDVVNMVLNILQNGSDDSE